MESQCISKLCGKKEYCAYLVEGCERRSGEGVVSGCESKSKEWCAYLGRSGERVVGGVKGRSGERVVRGGAPKDRCEPDEGP